MAKRFGDVHEETLLEFSRGGKTTYPIRVNRVDGGDVKYDIRNYYTDNNGDIRPTSRGVRFEAEHVADIVSSILNDCAEEGLEIISELLSKCSDEVKSALVEESK